MRTWICWLLIALARFIANDKRQAFAAPKVGVVVFRTTNGEREVLLLRRQPCARLHPMLLAIPAGSVEPSDFAGADFWRPKVLQKAARRELREETSLEVGPLTCLADGGFFHEDGLPAVAVCFSAQYVRGGVSIDRESTEHGWCSFREFEDLAGKGEVAPWTIAVLREFFARRC